MKQTCFVLFLFCVCAGSGWAKETEKVFCDFESKDYGNWTVTGEAFGPGPALGTLPGQMPVSGYMGKKLVNTFFKGDTSQGSLTSPQFTIEHNYISFLLGGGGHSGTHIDLIVDGKAVRTARGPNTISGGSEKLDWFSWNVADLQGKIAQIQIVDNETGGWGHINVDQIVFGSKNRMSLPATRKIKLEKHFLHFPVKTGAPKTWLRVEVDGKKVHEFIIELAETADDISFHGMLDISPYQGKTATLVAEKRSEDSNGLNLVIQSDLYPDSETAYKEKLRPQFHFAPRRGWTNDPNGLVFYEGEYHLFFQHNPYGVYWNNMTWGHVVSKDLLHWEELPDAIQPDPLGTIFSGSCVVDWKNTSGLQTGSAPPLFALYTYQGSCMRYGHPTTQAIAYSNDRGRTWTKYDKNPVIPHMIGGNRDPKVFWYEPTKRWIMSLYMDKEDYALFDSPDLKNWTKITDIKNLGCSECPDMFPLAVDNNQQNQKWVFWGGNGKYLIGSFNGKTFIKESKPLDMKWGGNDYAAQTYSDTPGRRIQISWMQRGDFPGMPFSQQFSIPRELSLKTTPDGIRLCVYPVKELESLRGSALKTSRTLLQGNNVLNLPDTELLDISMVISPGNASKIEMALHGQIITILPNEKVWTVNSVRAPLLGNKEKIDLRIVLDRTSIEVFLNGGLSQITKSFVPKEGQTFEKMTITTQGNGAIVESMTAWPLRGVWNQDK